MATQLRLVALAVAIVTLALWFFGGPNWGTTRIREARTFVNAETGQVERVWEYRFLPGTDFLLGGLGCAAVVLASSLLCRSGGKSDVQ